MVPGASQPISGLVKFPADYILLSRGHFLNEVDPVEKFMSNWPNYEAVGDG